MIQADLWLLASLSHTRSFARCRTLSHTMSDKNILTKHIKKWTRTRSIRINGWRVNVDCLASLVSVIKCLSFSFSSFCRCYCGCCRRHKVSGTEYNQSIKWLAEKKITRFFYDVACIILVVLFFALFLLLLSTTTKLNENANRCETFMVWRQHYNDDDGDDDNNNDNITKQALTQYKWHSNKYTHRHKYQYQEYHTQPLTIPYMNGKYDYSHCVPWESLCFVK